MPKCKHCHKSFANGNGKGSLTRHCAAVKASRNRKPTNWRAAGYKSKRKKNLNEGLSNPDGKKAYYDVMKVYSKRKGFSVPTCFCCGNSDWKFLVFDHIKERQKEHKGLGGVGIAAKLKNDKYPKGIQILCHNCNTGKEIFGGKCPHHLSKKGQEKLKSVGLPLGLIKH